MCFSSSFSGSLRLFFSHFSRSASDYADVIFPCGCSSVGFFKSFIQAGLVRVALSVIALGAAGTLTEVQQRWECVKVKAEDDIYSDLITSTFLSSHHYLGSVTTRAGRKGWGGGKRG